MTIDFKLLLYLAAVAVVGLVLADDRAKVIKFMRRQKILPKCLKEEGKTIDHCISDLKRYCGMQHVGNPEITEELMACVRRGIKCFVPPKPNATNDGFYNPVRREKFNKLHLTYFLENTPTRSKLRQDELQKMVEMSVSVWECYSKLTFSPVSSIWDADIILSFMPREHGWYHYVTKEKQPYGFHFDGPGGVLAHTFPPSGESGTMGSFHYDDEETWIEGHTTGIKLLPVTVHELGHTLGLNHIPGRENIMYELYDDGFDETKLDLGPQDIEEIQARYGARRCTRKKWQEYYRQKYPSQLARQPIPFLEESRELIQKPRQCIDLFDKCDQFTQAYCESKVHYNWMSKNCRKFCGMCDKDIPKLCTPSFWYKCPYKPMNNRRRQNKHQNKVCSAKKLDGIFKTPSGTLYIIVDGILYRRGSRDKTVSPVFKMKISDLSKNGPQNPTAATFSRRTKLLYLFEGDKLFVIKDFLESTREMKTFVLPKKLSSPTAAFILNRGSKDDIKIYKNGKVITFRTNEQEIEVLKSQSFASIFDVGDYKNRIPRSVDGAFQVNKKLRFITGSSVTVAYQQEDGRYSIPSSSMTPFGTEYLNCPQE